jgi:DNA-binding NarL/FixJ family response regulator
MHTHTILLAENDRDDEELVLLALDEAAVDADVVIVNDGEAAVDYFVEHAIRHHPASCDLMLLDLALPKLDGLRVLRQLRWLHRNDASELPPIVMLSDAADPELVTEAYRHGADGFLCKATSYSRFAEAIQQTVRYWLTASLHPSLHRRTIARLAPLDGAPMEARAVLG